MKVKIIPDMTGTVVVVFYLGRPNEVSYMWYPVVAWKLTVGDSYGVDVEPVITDDLGDVWCLEHTIGDKKTWVFPFDSTHETFAEARAEAVSKIEGFQREALAK